MEIVREIDREMADGDGARDRDGDGARAHCCKAEVKREENLNLTTAFCSSLKFA